MIVAIAKMKPLSQQFTITIIICLHQYGSRRDRGRDNDSLVWMITVQTANNDVSKFVVQNFVPMFIIIKLIKKYIRIESEFVTIISIQINKYVSKLLSTACLLNLFLNHYYILL